MATNIVFGCSDAMRDALTQYAHDNGLSRPELIRRAVAQTISYDLSAEPPLTRQRKYANDKERASAQRKRNKERRAKEREVLDTLMRELGAQNVDQMLAKLRKA